MWVRRATALVSGRRGKWVALAAWLVALAVSLPVAGGLSKAQDNDSAAYLSAQAESTRVLAQQVAFQPETTPAVVVYERVSGITPADRARSAADAAGFAKIPGVAGAVTGPDLSADGRALVTTVPIAKGNTDWNEIRRPVERIREIVGPSEAGSTVRVTGPAGVITDTATAVGHVDATLLYATLGVVIVILLLTYRSPVLWLLPILSVGGALILAQAAITLLARHADLTVNAQSASILTVLVFGAGTDYALLLVARYREELRHLNDRHTAMASAMRQSLPAIVASAGTVTAGMLCLTVADAASTSGMGPVAAVGVLTALLAVLTLFPALLVILGRWLFWPQIPVHRPTAGDPSTTSGGWARIGRQISKRPRFAWVGTAMLLGALSLGLGVLKADGIAASDSFVDKPESVIGATTLAAHFPAGNGQPVVIMGKAESADRLHDIVARTRGVAEVTQPKTEGDRSYLEATLADPADGKAAQETVRRIRTNVHAISGAAVGGTTAILVDTNAAAAHDRALIVPLVLAVVFLILAVLLRALVAPLLLIGTVVLSFGAALGTSALLFEALGHRGGDPSMPLFVFVFLVALGIDYNIFLVTRIREETIVSGEPRAGVLTGLTTTGGVITSAGLVLAGTFAMLATLPLIAYAQIGIAVALGVLMDTIIVRAILVTALAFDAGRKFWWPGGLSRLSLSTQADRAPGRKVSA